MDEFHKTKIFAFRLAHTGISLPIKYDRYALLQSHTDGQGRSRPMLGSVNIVHFLSLTFVLKVSQRFVRSFIEDTNKRFRPDLYQLLQKIIYTAT